MTCVLCPVTNKTNISGPLHPLFVLTIGPVTFLRTNKHDKAVAQNKKKYSNITDGMRHKNVVGRYGTKLYP